MKMLLRIIIVFLLVLFCFQRSSFGCGSRPNLRRLPGTDEDPSGWYSLSNTSPRKCANLIGDVDHKKEVSVDTNCDLPLLPGITTITRGYYPLSADGLSEDTPYALSCSDMHGYHGNKTYSVLQNITFQKLNQGMHYDLFKMDRWIVKKDWTDNKLDRIVEDKHNRMTSYEEALKKSSYYPISINQTQYNGFRLSAKTLKPSKSLLFTYRSLPNELEEDYASYFKFVKKYGTAVRVVTYVGGIYEEFHSFGDDDTREDVVITLSPKVAQRFSGNPIYASGINGTTVDVGQWENLITNTPVPLFSEVVPLYDFIDPHSSTQKRKSLERMVKAVEENHEIKLLIKALSFRPTEHSLEKFVYQEIQKEKEYLCVREQVSKMVQNWIINADNVGLNKFFLSCTQDPSYIPSEHSSTYAFKLVPGVCFTKNVQLTECISSQAVIPSGVKCVKFFVEKDCIGEDFQKAGDRDVHDVSYGLVYGKSFSYC